MQARQTESWGMAPNAKMAPVVKVGKFLIKDRIGGGAFTEIRLAVHGETGKEYAVKVFDKDLMSKADGARTDIKKEIKIMQRLCHPNIIAIETALVTNSRLYLVMELVNVGELYAEILSQKKIDEDTSRRYFQQLIDAVLYCHRRGVFHRDLRPQNMLLNNKGNLKLTDFGFAWMSDNEQQDRNTKELLKTRCGTPKYMAPEIVNGADQGYDGSKLDAWNCGMILYVLLAGGTPFVGEDDDTMLQSILKDEVKFPCFFSSGAKSVLTLLLEKDPNKRASLEEVRQTSWFQINYFEESTVPLSSQTAPEGAMNTRGSPSSLSRNVQTRGAADARAASQRAGGNRPGGSRPYSNRSNVGIARVRQNSITRRNKTVFVKATSMAVSPTEEPAEVATRKKESEASAAETEEPLRPLSSLLYDAMDISQMMSPISQIISPAGAVDSDFVPDDDDAEDNAVPMSFKDRFSGSTLGSMVKTMRFGMSSKAREEKENVPGPITTPLSLSALPNAKESSERPTSNAQRSHGLRGMKMSPRGLKKKG